MRILASSNKGRSVMLLKESRVVLAGSRSSDAGSGGVQTRISATCFGDDAVNCGLGSGVGREIGLLRAVLRAWS